MAVVYRAFEHDDCLELASLSDDEWVSTHSSVAFSLLKNNSVEQCYVAADEGQIVGYIYGFVLPNGTLIPEFLYVLPNYRKQGIGKELLKKLENESNCSNSMIFYNSSLHDYYAKQGYNTGENLETALKDLSSNGRSTNEV